MTSARHPSLTSGASRNRRMSTTSSIQQEKTAILPAHPRAASDRLGVESSLLRLPGIGPKRAAMLAERGIETLGDLLLSFPSRYLDWRQVKPIHEIIAGETATVAGRLTALSER